MMHEVGETYSTRFRVTDAAGAPADAGTVTVAITLPDGSTATPSTSHPDIGIYDLDYTGAQIGRYELVATATGGTLGSLVRKFTDVFHLEPTPPGFLVSLGDVKAELNIRTDATDEELRGYIGTASDLIEQATNQYWHRATVTDLFTPQSLGGYQSVLVLRNRIAYQVDTVTEAETLLGVSEYALTQAGNLRRLYGGWVGGETGVSVTYRVGAGPVPFRIRHATTVLVRHLWQTQRGPSQVALGGGPPGGPGYDPRFSYSLPRAVLELLHGTDTGVRIG